MMKTISWRGLAFVVTTCGVWMITGRPTLAASVGLLEVVVKSFGYYVHECAWEWVDLHRLSGLPFFASLRVRAGWLNEESSAVQPEELTG
jgi:uncharacterized membrane protein